MDPNEPYNTNNPDFTKKPVFWQIVVLMVLLIVIFSSAIINELSDFSSVAKPPSNTEDVSNNAAAVIASQELPPSVTFGELPLQAKAAYVYDLQTDTVLYEKNADTPLPLASVTKLMTALITHEILETNDTVAIDLAAVLQDGDSGLIGGETFDVATLNDLVLMTSSNDGAYALADAAGGVLGVGADSFVAAMNIRAEQLELSSLAFKNPTGLDIQNEQQPGAVGSAADVAQLLSYIVTEYPEILESTTELSKRFYNDAGAYHDARNTNGTVAEIDGLLGSKTGYTDLAGGNLAIVYDAGLNHPIVIVVLGSSRTGRFTDVLTLVDAVNDAFTETN